MKINENSSMDSVIMDLSLVNPLQKRGIKKWTTLRKLSDVKQNIIIPILNMYGCMMVNTL